MSKQMTPKEMESQFRKWKVDLRLWPGWQTRGYGPGSISDVEGVMIHHTGSDGQSDDYLEFLFVRGRDDLPAPLCNWATDMDGDLWLGAAERANHAGSGSAATLGKVQTGNYKWRDVEIKPGPDGVNGNSRYYGNEVRYDGGQPMARAQWITVILSSAAACDFHGWGAWHVIGHKEHTGRKWDPGKALMHMIRSDVEAALKAGPGNWPTKQEDSMSAAEVQDLKNYIDQKFTAAFGASGTVTLRDHQIINESRNQAAQLASLLSNVQKWLNDEEVEEDFRDQLAGDRWAQGTREGREQAAAVLADAQVKAEAVQSKLDALADQPTPPPPTE